jgi:sensor histidine kinase regulating citrate/malate metabolism
LKRIMVILTIVAVLVAMAATAGPVLAQTDDKAAKRAAKRTLKQAQKA